MALDVGARRIGVALGDNEVKLASPAEAIENDGQALAEICRLVVNHRIKTVVVGLPRNAEGLETKQSEYCRQFADDLEDAMSVSSIRGVEVVFQDESLTSVQAEAMLRRDKKHFKEQMLRDGRLDSQAAVVILTDYLGGVK